MPPAATTAESLVPHLKRCGYRDAQIERPFNIDRVTIPVAAFAGRPFDSWSACIAAVNLNGDSRDSAAEVQALGASTVFVCGPRGVDWWAMGPNGPTSSRPIAWPDVGGVFHKHRDELAPSRIYSAKLRRPGCLASQLWFFDAGLMPAVEKNRGEALLRLVENAIGELRKELGTKLNSRQAQEDVYRTVFWLLAAKVLHDKRVPNFINIDLKSVEQIFDRIGKHHGETGRFPPFGKEGRPAIDAVAADLAKSGSLADVSSESIAFVYENALLDKSAGNGKETTGAKAYDIRKELGIHSTPSVLIHHMLAQMWGMIEEIEPGNRTVFEPACGHAPFLTGAMRWLRSWNMSGQAMTDHDYMRKHLRGLEADSFSVELARLALTLADEPHGNSWAIQTGDMFAPGVLARESKHARILLSNPPYEAFLPAKRKQYDKLGEAVTANTKAVELLKRTLPHLSPGSIFGVVMPVGVLHDKESTRVREELLKDFDLSEISVFADNLFEHGDHEVAVLIGRRKTPQSNTGTLWYRRVREKCMVAFKQRLEFSWERRVSQSRFVGGADLRIPELDEVWAYLAAESTLDTIATIGQGLFHRGEVSLRETWTIHDPACPGDTLGFANVSDGLRIYGIPKLVGINLEDSAIDRIVAGAPLGSPQVLLNYAPVAREPWKLKATLDERGRALTSRFSAIRPRAEGPTALYLWALLNSPVANAFVYDHLGKRDVLVGTMRKMPVPGRTAAHEAMIVQAALRYRQLATSAGPLFSGESSPEGIKRALLDMDAAVLRAYDLPPRLERQLLDLFTGVERKGVGCDFRGYYPPGFTSCLPLHMVISDRFQRAAADATAARFKPGESVYVRNALRVAAGTGEE